MDELVDGGVALRPAQRGDLRQEVGPLGAVGAELGLDAHQPRGRALVLERVLEFVDHL